jgi:riboflavin synthase
VFTGLVEALATVRSLEKDNAGSYLVLDEPTLAPQLSIGESIAVNGACLTVVVHDLRTFSFQVGPETLLRTNLGQLAVGDPVNVERSLRVDDRLGGHLVQGHVDGVGVIASREQQGDWEVVRFTCAPELTSQMVSKGSVAVDGISLTVVGVTTDQFSVALIPHTLAVTTLARKAPGATVNLETDVLAKYVWKYLQAWCSGTTQKTQKS